MRRIRNIGESDGVRAGRAGEHGPLRRFTVLLPYDCFERLESMSAERAAPISSLIRAAINRQYQMGD